MKNPDSLKWVWIPKIIPFIVVSFNVVPLCIRMMQHNKQDDSILYRSEQWKYIVPDVHGIDSKEWF